MAFHIAVIGAGPSGLCLARILQLNGVSVTVYEGEESRNARSQGGALDMHVETGQRAIAVAGLTAEFRAKLEPGLDAMQILDAADGAVLFEDAGDGGKARPEIERGDLRDIFLDSLEPGTVVWGRKLLAVQPPALESGPLSLRFADGTTATADVVVGADGAWSRVRAVLTTAVPAYTGVTMLDIRLPHDFDNKSRGLKTGMLIARARDEAHCLFAYLGQLSRAYFAVKTDKPASVTPSLVYSIVKDWEGGLRDVAMGAAEDGVVRQIVALPRDISVNRDYTANPQDAWKKCVAVIGDAAHVAPPNGEGANLALADAADLAKALLDAMKNPRLSETDLTRHDRIGRAIAKFEKMMWKRSAVEADEAMNFMELFYGPGGAQAIADWMRSQFSVKNMLYMGFKWILNSTAILFHSEK
ncbi:hypothetical protein HDU83_003283, partial [Entophlyctis luteolus]